MRKFIGKLLMRLFFADMFRLESVDEKKLSDWLFLAYADRGYAQYHTMRKKYIANLMGNGLSREDYLICLGRLQELRALSDNVLKEFNRRKALEEKKKPKQKK